MKPGVNFGGPVDPHEEVEVVVGVGVVEQSGTSRVAVGQAVVCRTVVVGFEGVRPVPQHLQDVREIPFGGIECAC